MRPILFLQMPRWAREELVRGYQEGRADFAAERTCPRVSGRFFDADWFYRKGWDSGQRDAAEALREIRLARMANVVAIRKPA